MLFADLTPENQVHFKSANNCSPLPAFASSLSVPSWTEFHLQYCLLLVLGIGCEFFPLWDRLWLNWNSNDGVVYYLGLTLRFPPKSDAFYHFLSGIHYKTTAVMYIIYIALVILIYGPKRLWASSVHIHPLRLFNYVLACFGIIYVFYELMDFLGVYHGNPARHYVPAFSERMAHMVLGPIAEEFAFRLTLFQSIRYYFGFIRTAVISSAAFGLMHFSYHDPLKIAVASVIGLVFAWAYEKTGSILAPIGIHVLNNTWSQMIGF